MDHGAVMGMDEASAFDVGAFQSTVASVSADPGRHQALASVGCALVDGRGSERVAELLVPTPDGELQHRPAGAHCSSGMLDPRVCPHGREVAEGTAEALGRTRAGDDHPARREHLTPCTYPNLNRCSLPCEGSVGGCSVAGGS